MFIKCEIWYCAKNWGETEEICSWLTWTYNTGTNIILVCRYGCTDHRSPMEERFPERLREEQWLEQQI